MIKSTELVHFRKISNLIKFVFSFDLAFCEVLGGGGGGGGHPILCECWCCDRDPGVEFLPFLHLSIERAQNLRVQAHCPHPKSHGHCQLLFAPLCFK